MQENLQELTENSNLKRKEYGTVMSSKSGWSKRGKRNRAGAVVRKILEGGPPELLRRYHACACDGERVHVLPMSKDRLAKAIGLVLDGS